MSLVADGRAALPEGDAAPGRATTMAANGPAPAAAGTLYRGTVMHARLRPFGHRFSYSVFSLLLDIDRLDELGTATALLRVNRPGPVSFQVRDHVERAGDTLRGHVERQLAAAGLERPPARVLLLCYPRILGYAFNPLATWFCYDAAGRLVAMVYAVRNTFGGRHAYVAPVLPGELSPAGLRQERAKRFHVSPFIDMTARYAFRILPPGRVVRLRINESDAEGPLLAAAFHGSAEPLTTLSLARCLARFPLMTFKVVAGIHWEALKLWLKGARFHPTPTG